MQELPIHRPTTGTTFARFQPRLFAILSLMVIGILAYNERIFLPSYRQVAHRLGYDQGNLSDLYSRWTGTQLLLQQRQNPYSDDVLAISQRGFFGRDPAPGEQLSETAVFSHPLYVVFLLAPLALFDFMHVQEITRWLFPSLVALGTLLWSRTVTQIPTWAVGIIALVAPPTLEIARVQQLTAPTYFFLIVAMCCIIKQRYRLGGVLLALSTIKPQESWGVILLLTIWAFAAWSRRRDLVISFTATLTILAIGAEVLLPGWVVKFVVSTLRYVQNTSAQRAFSHLLPGWLLVIGGITYCGLLLWISWHTRIIRPDSPTFITAMVVALTLTQVILPTYLQYENIYLLPATLWLFRNRSYYQTRFLFILYGTLFSVLCFPWLSASILGILALFGVAFSSASLVIIFMPFGLGTVLPHLSTLLLLPLLYMQRGLDKEEAGLALLQRSSSAGTS